MQTKRNWKQAKKQNKTGISNQHSCHRDINKLRLLKINELMRIYKNTKEQKENLCPTFSAPKEAFVRIKSEYT